jgi:hypothetical protein
MGGSRTEHKENIMAAKEVRAQSGARKQTLRSDILAHLKEAKPVSGKPGDGKSAPTAGARNALRHEIALSHKFKPGQTVTLTPSRYGSNRQAQFQVVRLLPAEHGIHHYRLKSVADGHERVAAENELS